MQKKIKIYASGGDYGYTNWLNRVLVDTIEEADLVFFTGGEDVDPAFYKEKIGEFTDINRDRDIQEARDAENAISLGKPIFGTCRGAQLGCVLSGGKLIQHMNHPSVHNITLYDGTIVQTNSLHHQLQRPFNLHPIEYVVAGYARGLSNIYLDGNNEKCTVPSIVQGGSETLKEPELVYYRKNNWLGIQGHPEMMNYNSKLCSILRAMVDLQLEGNLDLVLSLDIPTSRYVDSNLKLSSDEIQLYENMIAKRKEVEVSVVN